MNLICNFILTTPFFYTIMQIVGKPEKPTSRKPLILLGLRLVIQVVLPLGSCAERCTGLPLLPAPTSKALYIKTSGIFIVKEKTITAKKQVHNLMLCICRFFTVLLPRVYRQGGFLCIFSQCLMQF